jgi:hypothetical protein
VAVELALKVVKMTLAEACHTSHVTRHTSHVTRHTSHVTRHTSHLPRARLRQQQNLSAGRVRRQRRQRLTKHYANAVAMQKREQRPWRRRPCLAANCRRSPRQSRQSTCAKCYKNAGAEARRVLANGVHGRGEVDVLVLQHFVNLKAQTPIKVHRQHLLAGIDKRHSVGDAE